MPKASDEDEEAELDALLRAVEPRVGRDAAVAAAELFLGELELPFPPAPQEWLDQLLELGPGRFATRTGLPEPTATEAWLERLRAGALSDHLAFGLGGHGLADRAVFYSFVRGPLALLVRVPWGGAYDDPSVQAGEVRRAFDLVAELITAHGLERLPAGRRLIVVQGDPMSNRLGWLNERGESELRPHPAPLAEALALVEGMTPRDRGGWP